MPQKIFESIEFYSDSICLSAETALEIRQVCQKIKDCPEALSTFEKIPQEYGANANYYFEKLTAEMHKVSSAIGIHEYTGNLIMLLSLCEGLKDRYKERGIPEDIFRNTIIDLKYKCEECRLVYGICGIFAHNWFKSFFNLSRFGLRRLQFEIIDLPIKFELDGMTMMPPVKAINVHIPRTGGKLDRYEVKESYRLAKEFFRDSFEDRPVVFTCHSWLLYPWNMTVLSPESNLRAFCSDYKIIRVTDYPNYDNAWRLFDCLYTGDASKLSRDSSLRRAYADRIGRGEPMGTALGVFIYKD